MKKSLNHNRIKDALEEMGKGMGRAEEISGDNLKRKKDLIETEK